MSKKKSDPAVAMLAGCIAGGIEATAVWPMEYIKTQLQLMEKLPPGQTPKYTGMIGGLRYTVRSTGFFSLYKGLTPTLLGSIPKAGIRFGGNSYFKKLLADENEKLNPAKNLIAGMGAGMAEAIFAVTPIETVKTKLIQTNAGFVEGTRLIIREQGIAGLYQGLGATILKQASNQGLRFMFFNEYKNWATKNSSTPLSPIASLIGGMLAGCFSTLELRNTGNNPFDVVKTRMQGMDAHKYKGTLDCFYKITAQEGIVGFYRGIVPRLGRVIPGQGVIFMSFEVIESWLKTVLKR